MVHGPGLLPEAAVDGTGCTNPIGHADTKLVCERMLERVPRGCGGQLETFYARISQIAGAMPSVAGNPDEHIAALVKSSQRVGALLRLRGSLSWLPVDMIDTVCELLLASDTRRVVYHVENPVRHAWSDVLDVFATELGLTSAARLPPGKRLDQVCTSADTDEEANLAKGLAESFRKVFERVAYRKDALSTDQAREYSLTLRHAEDVQDGVMKRFVERWRRTGHVKPS